MSAEQHALLDARRVMHDDAGIATAMKPAEMCAGARR